MKHLLKVFLTCSVVAGLHQAAHAQVSYSSSTTITSWAGVPIYTSLANSALSGASTAQGDPTITGANGVLAETFTTSGAFTLGSFNVLLSVNNAGTYGVDLLDLGPAGTVSVSSASATYTAGTMLFSDTVALTGPAGAVQGMFSLSGADRVSLLANEEYALEILTPTALGQNGVTWFRGSTADPGGQMFSGGDSAGTRNTLAGSGQAGGAPRTGALALYTVPEPSTAALFCLGGLALLKKKLSRDYFKI
ncbi:MAG TPA: PEP-CTERM sorting domain-containing protein [Verrucomicrobiae bacterium]|nr:PEP-CTERM sorting domain-containing protein [Verrucomicrobiae bacterium]